MSARSRRVAGWHQGKAYVHVRQRRPRKYFRTVPEAILGASEPLNAPYPLASLTLGFK